jgi:hypothetical protein
MTPDLPATETAIVEMTNAFRASESRSALRRNALLDRIAQSYADYLARTGKFSHTADGRKPAERADRAGYKYCQFAENLALNRDSRGFETRQLADAAVTGWKNSPGHRRNMLTQYATEIGVGIAKAADKQQYLSVQVFGRPLELRYQFAVRNETRTRVSYRLGDDQNAIPARAVITHTTCKPHDISFEIKTTPKSFPTARGDKFVITRGASGNLVVRHVPQVD